MTYCFKCPKCGRTGEFSSRVKPICRGYDDAPHYSVACIRDYRAESVGLSIESLREAHRK